MSAYRELHLEAERRGLRVTLSIIEKETGSKIERLSLVDLHSNEVASIRVGRLGLDRASGALLEFLAKRSSPR